METKLSTELADRIRAETGENVFLCYHCTKCTSGCPLTDYFDLAPNQVVRAAQLGMESLIYESRTPWLCASCQTCTTRCPQGLDLARVMDFLIGEATAKKYQPQVPEAALFNKVFLRDVDLLGRSYELGLILEMNLRTRQPFKDVGLGLEMFKHGKINILPPIVRRQRRKTPIAPASRPPNEIGYYPGCSLHSLAKEFDRSARASLEVLGFKLVEPQGWICCGSTPAHKVDHELATKMPIESLVLYEQEGLSEVTLPCAMCFSRFRTATREWHRNPELKQAIDNELRYEYRNSVKISALPNLIFSRCTPEEIASLVKLPLEGLKVACYYGCLLTRPPEVTGSTEVEYPMTMDRLMEALGAISVDWDRKVACCGGSLTLTQTQIVIDLSREILENARARGADLIVLACPMCHANMDGRQAQMEDFQTMPILYFTQLMALAFGLPDKAALNFNMVDPKPLLTERGLL